MQLIMVRYYIFEQGQDVVQRYQNYLENYVGKTRNKKSSYVYNVLML